MSDLNKRKQQPASKLTDPDNVGDIEGSTAISRQLSPITPTRHSTATVEDVDEDGPLDEDEPAAKKLKTKKKAKKPWISSPLPSPAPHTESGNKSESSSKSEIGKPVIKESRIRDIDESFGPLVLRGPKGSQKRYRRCLRCLTIEKFIVSETTTLRQHIQASHQGSHNAWCKRNGVESKLPAAVRARKDAKKAQQSTLDDIVEEKERVVPYSDTLFQEAAEDWLIATDQPIGALSHPEFKTMIDVASQARNGIKILDKRTTRENIVASCLAHTINLATQAVLGTYSKTPHFNPGSTAPLEPNVDVTDEELMCDVVGVVRCIAVKARSSAKQNALLKELQAKDGVKIPLTLLVDMKVRWSSTYLMLEQAYELCKYINLFLSELSFEEANIEKQNKLLSLRLSSEEWEQFADQAQQAFSSETEPSLYNGLPVLERLHKAWTSCSKKEKYKRYRPALEAGLAKIEDYYNKTSYSHAYTMAMKALGQQA
ncbi:hypothetical protein H1R20_g13556, partial [Candolleomyces eurysporus]